MTKKNAASQLYGVCLSVAAWLEGDAAKAEAQAHTATSNFPAFADSCRFDARNKRAVAKDLRTAVEAAKAADHAKAGA